MSRLVTAAGEVRGRGGPQGPAWVARQLAGPWAHRKVEGGSGEKSCGHSSHWTWGFLSPATRHPGFSSIAKALDHIHIDPQIRGALTPRNWGRAGGVSVRANTRRQQRLLEREPLCGKESRGDTKAGNCFPAAAEPLGTAVSVRGGQRDEKTKVHFRARFSP